VSEKPLTQKERIFVESRLSGMTQVASAAAAGCGSPNKDGHKFENRPRVQKEMVRRMQAVSEEVDFGRKEAHDMLMDAYRNADTAMEQIAAVREMIKLHGIAEPAKTEHTVKHEQTLSLDRMDLKQLMDLAGTEDFTLEGEFEVIAELPALEVMDDNEQSDCNG
jgi:phage terminase small subunit